MKIRTSIAALALTVLPLAACSAGAAADAVTPTSSVSAEAADTATDTTGSDTTDTTDTDPGTTGTTDTTAGTTQTGRGGAGGGAGGPGSVDVASVDTVSELDAMIQAAYGDAALGLHRGHQPVEATLIEVLGISHDEMHVRMEEQGQNLAAVATDVGVDPQTLIDALVAQWSPGIDQTLAAGEITADQADAYLAALQEAFTYRVTWNGTDATPTFAGIA